MGKDIYEKSKVGREIFKLADVIRPGTSAQCFEGTKEELSLTINTQPCLFTVDLAAAAAIEELGVKCDVAAGFSLGEIAAIGFSGILDYSRAFELVCKRAKFMNDCSLNGEGGMAAVMGMTAENLNTLLAIPEFSGFEAVNYNCPGQIVVSGPREKLENFGAEVKKAGGKFRPLQVSGAFHSSYMNDASAKMDSYLKTFYFSQGRFPIYSNMTALPYKTGEEAKMLSQQINHPVLWQRTIENMLEAGCDTFIEVGAGNVLCGLIERIIKEKLDIVPGDEFPRTIHYKKILEEGRLCLC